VSHNGTKDKYVGGVTVQNLGIYKEKCVFVCHTKMFLIDVFLDDRISD